jgi:DNA-binding winged helix-turn-helix (wHTH) protein
LGLVLRKLNGRRINCDLIASKRLKLFVSIAYGPGLSNPCHLLGGCLDSRCWQGGNLPMSLEVQPNGIRRFGVFEVDLRSGELRKQGVRIKLQDQPFQVLELLLQSAGELVTREELRSRICAGDTFVDFDNGLNTSINKLREALGDSADSPRFIETLLRRGYRLLAPCS